MTDAEKEKQDKVKLGEHLEAAAANLGIKWGTMSARIENGKPRLVKIERTIRLD